MNYFSGSMSTAKNVEDYYDSTTGTYLKIYGEVIQAFRPSSQSKLLAYLKNSIGFKKGQKIVDAGCGVGGPALYFASKCNVQIHGLTISGVQAQIANEKIAQKKMHSKVSVIKGDYHEMSTLLPKASYDGVIFLESLGHAENPVQVINEVAQVIRPGGFIYIKDFFKKESKDATFQEKVDTVIERMNESYCYNTLQLLPILEALRANDFEIEFIKKFDFKDDTGIRAEFEKDQKIEIFKGFNEFWPAEWLEIKCKHSKS